MNMHETKTHLSHLVEEAAAGDGLLICKAGEPMVRVTAIHQSELPAPRSRRLGLPEGQCSLPDEVDQLGSVAIADLFEGA